MQWLAGTSGYSYKEWRGSFYPEDLQPDDMLACYAGQLPAVEINNTFYRMPRTHVLEAWAAAVPTEFRFIIKASRRITHQARLAPDSEALPFLARGAGVLGEKLGGVLFQLPPFFQKDAARLGAFLESWPRELPAAIEFRHASWHSPEIWELMEHHGAALCVSEDGSLALPSRIATSDWVYLRLRRATYSSAELGRWLRVAEATGAGRGYAFFKHEDDAGGPELAKRFLELARRPAPKRAPRSRPRTGEAGRARASKRSN